MGGNGRERGSSFLSFFPLLDHTHTQGESWPSALKPSFSNALSPSLWDVDWVKSELSRERRRVEGEGHLRGGALALPGVAPQRGVVQRVEAVVVGDHHVGVPVEQQGQHVVALLADGVV